VTDSYDSVTINNGRAYQFLMAPYMSFLPSIHGHSHLSAFLMMSIGGAAWENDGYRNPFCKSLFSYSF
jgi:hypothetical protein